MAWVLTSCFVQLSVKFDEKRLSFVCNLSDTQTVIPRLYRQPCKISSAEGTSHLHVAFNEACSLDSSLYVKTDVHLDVSPLVGQLDDWHLKDEVKWLNKHYSHVFL